MSYIRKHARSLVRVVSAAGLMALTTMASAAPLYSIANDPLFLVTNIPPNITLTLDDSGSMASAYVPDGLDAYKSDNRFKSSTFNALYYNPSVTYSPPLDASGSPLSTTFDQAWINGFDHTRGSVDLSSDYYCDGCLQRKRKYGVSAPVLQRFGDLFAEHADTIGKRGVSRPRLV